MSTQKIRTQSRRRVASVSSCVAMLAVFSAAGPATAQQPFQLPTSIGAPNGLSQPIDAVGTFVLVRRDLPFSPAIGLYSDSGPSVIFSPFLTGTRAQAILDPRLERGTQFPTRIFCTEAAGAVRVLQQVTAGGTTTLATLPAGNWQLQALSLTNSRFLFIEPGSGRIARFDAGLGPTFLVLGTVPGAQTAELSPNAQTAVLNLPSGNPFTPSQIATMSAINIGGTVNVLTAVTIGRPHWLDNRFLAVIEAGITNRIRRIDTTNLAASEFLTVAPVNVDMTGELSISDNHEWLAFVTQQTVMGNIERVPAVMRVANGPSGPNGPGGAYIELGDYRTYNNPPPANLTNWFNLGRPVVALVNLGTTVAPVRVIFHGARAFQNPVEIFRADVWDDTAIAQRGLQGTTINVESVAPPFATLWGMFISLGRSATPVAVSGTFNALLIDNPATLFFAGATSGQPIAVPITLPTAPGISGIRLMFQGAWLTNQPNLPPHFSHVSELPVF